jgi:hypothetical protein
MDNATSIYIAAQPFKNELKPSIRQTNGIHKRRQRKHCTTTDGTLMIITHNDDANIPITRPISRWDKRWVLWFVVNKWILIIKEIIEAIRSNEAANRENRHSFIEVCRTNVELDKFAIEYKQSIGIDTWNKQNILRNSSLSLTIMHCVGYLLVIKYNGKFDFWKKQICMKKRR